MMSINQRFQVQSLINDFSPAKLTSLFRSLAPGFRPDEVLLTNFVTENTSFILLTKLGVIELPNTQTVIVIAVHVSGATN